MKINLYLSSVLKNDEEKKAKMHWMPCVIKATGKAKVSAYFEPIITKTKKEGILQASFRGYPLLGKELNVPENFQGVVVQETLLRFSLTADRNTYGTHAFDKFTYWNWDEEPSENDKVQMSLDWLDVAEALHSPIDSLDD